MVMDLDEANHHCYHSSPSDDDWDVGDGDYCVHCDCCCTCLSCEYGPRDGMLMYPDGAPWAQERGEFGLPEEP